MSVTITLSLTPEGRRLLSDRAGESLARQMEAGWAIQSEHKLKAIQEAVGSRLRGKPESMILTELRVWLKTAGVRLADADKVALAGAIRNGEDIDFRFESEFTLTNDAREAFREVFPY